MTVKREFLCPKLASSVIVSPNDASISASQNSHFEESPKTLSVSQNLSEVQMKFCVI